MAHEEVRLIDQSLESMPALVPRAARPLLSRGQSVAKVAELLDLSTDAVKQRLSRGRRMLRDEVTRSSSAGSARALPIRPSPPASSLRCR